MRAVVEAIEWARSQRLRVVTSVGMQTWELVLVAALRAGVPVDVYALCPPAADRADVEAGIRAAFGLTGTDRVILLDSVEGTGKRDGLARRDARVVAAADILLPISVRPKGTMTATIARAAAGGTRLIETFTVPYSRRTAPLKFSLDPSRLSSVLMETTDTWLVHWTRTANGPWPTETARSYYDALLDSDTYPRGGFQTLCNILATGRIAASGRHMPARTPTVSFTGRPPHAFVPLMRWRARYREMSFEPYGIGIARSCAADYGIRPVVYHPAGAPDHEAFPAEAWLRQSTGRITWWGDEDEYRCVGDLDLRALPGDRLIAFCRTAGEARALTARYGIPAIGFTDANE
ncbi:MAG: hypothetical protein GF331_03750 [Chitinivibrionales bacterium]|nr:hypothetical protein [Chitinivibrionales bacterium]